jgi:hypothetical protein
MTEGNNEMLAVVEEDIADETATIDKKDLKSLLKVEDLEEEKRYKSLGSDEDEFEGDVNQQKKKNMVS